MGYGTSIINTSQYILTARIFNNNNFAINFSYDIYGYHLGGLAFSGVFDEDVDFYDRENARYYIKKGRSEF